MQELQAEEERYSRINRHKVQNQWRKLMRIAKVEELIKEVSAYRTLHGLLAQRSSPAPC